MSKPYAGMKDPVPQGTTRATAEQAILSHQVRYYGIKSLPIKIIHEIQAKHKIEPLKVKLAVMHIKMKKQLQLYRYEPDLKKKDKYKVKAKAIATEFEKLRKEIQQLEKKQ